MASTSEFNTIQTRGGSGFRTFAAGSASISSQLYFADAGNTRAWNWQLDENNNAALWHFTGAAWARKLSIVHGGDAQAAVPSFIQMDNSYSTTPLWDSLKFYLYKDSGQSYGIGLGSSADVQYWSGASNNGLHRFYTSRTMQFEIGPGGACIATGDLRAPIFYDSNNTGYFLDPNSSGLALRTSGYWIADSTAWAGDINGKIQYHANQWYFSSAASWIFRASSGAEPFTVNQGGTAIAAADMRAPIFYDNNNTAYYVDPNSTSNLVGLTVANIINGFVTGCTFAEDSVNKDDIATRSDSGFYQSSSGTTAEGWPINDGNWQHMISCTHSNDGNYFAMQLGASFFSQGLFYRTVANSGTQAWSRVALYGNNYGAALYASIYYDADNTAFYLDAHSTGTSLNVAGSIVAAGNVTAYSDIRVKANVETIPSALDKLDQIRGVTYTRTDLDDKDQRYAGVIAQEIEAVLPEAVRDLGNIKAVDYNATIALLIQAVKELTDKVKALEAKEQ
jgi:hypothetical protein